jgi:hypothetical protein
MFLRRSSCWHILSLFMIAGACATGFPDQDFLLFTLSQDFSSGRVVTVFQGQMDLDDLPDRVKQQLMANGYEAGDMVPALCRMSESGENARCDFHIRSRPDDTGDWMYIGTSKPNLFDDLSEWRQRKGGI